MKIAKKYKLFLDDIRDPREAYPYTGFQEFLNDDWKIVRNYDQFVDYVTKNWKTHKAFPTLIAFDHDLSIEDIMKTDNFKEKTGMDCAKWLVDFCIDNNLELPNWISHSMNPAGRDNINLFLKNYLKLSKKNGN
jgi:hypothetical protein